MNIKDIIELNKMPVNQYARILLQKAEQYPDRHTLHLYQLITWGLETYEAEFLDSRDPFAQDNLLEAAYKIQRVVSPQKQMDLLMKMGPGEDVTWVEPTLLIKMEPAEAAQYLSECLLDALQSLVP